LTSLSYEKAREFARSSEIKNAKQWFSTSKNSKLPDGVPSNAAQRKRIDNLILVIMIADQQTTTTILGLQKG
jgi:hypothetical protein